MAMQYYRSKLTGCVYRRNENTIDVWVGGLRHWASTGFEVADITKNKDYTKISAKEALMGDMFK